MNKDDPIARATTTSEELSYEVKHRGPPTELGLPVHWHDDAGKTHLRGQDARVVGATPQDVEDYAEQHLTICGDCKYFDLEKGREERFRLLSTGLKEWEQLCSHSGPGPKRLEVCRAHARGLATALVVAHEPTPDSRSVFLRTPRRSAPVTAIAAQRFPLRRTTGILALASARCGG